MIHSNNLLSYSVSMYIQNIMKSMMIIQRMYDGGIITGK